jgi:hypothetical protein
MYVNQKLNHEAKNLSERHCQELENGNAGLLQQIAARPIFPMQLASRARLRLHTSVILTLIHPEVVDCICS